MNDLETALGQILNLATSDERVKILRTEVLAGVDQELRSRRRDRLATRLVLGGLLLGIVGNFSVDRREAARMARWFPNVKSPMREFTEPVLVDTKVEPSRKKKPFEDYLLAFYSAPHNPWGGNQAARSARARAMETWIEEFTKTGQRL